MWAKKEKDNGEDKESREKEEREQEEVLERRLKWLRKMEEDEEVKR